MKILHFAAENFARIPANLVRAERALGHESLLMTLYPSAHGFKDEDICLNAPFVRTPAVRSLKKILHPKAPAQGGVRRGSGQGPPVWRPGNPLSDVLFRLRDRIWAPRIRRALKSIPIETVDILFLDGGLGFFRNDALVRGFKERGMKIVVGYYGSDLRTRGMIPGIDALADYRFTMEFDHTLLYPGIDFVFFPFLLPGFPVPAPRASGAIRIGHSPSNRAVKGTDSILEQLALLQKTHRVEVVLIEGLPQPEALSLKSTCDLFVDCIGELGYGISGLEAMAMGIPTAAEIWPDFGSVLGDHPFINVSKSTIAAALAPYCESAALRRERGGMSRAWVSERHDPAVISKRILERIGSARSTGGSGRYSA
jgi:hypothetical protein